MSNAARESGRRWRGRGNAVRSYLNNLARLSEERWGVREPADVLSPALQIDAFRHRAAQLVSRVGLDVRGRIAAGADFKAAFDANTVDTVEATKAHWCACGVLAKRDQGHGPTPL